MGDSNGNGNGKLKIDVTNEDQFRLDVAQNLQLIADRTSCLVDLKKTVDKHEQIVRFGKWAAIPSHGILYLLWFWIKTHLGSQNG